MFNAHGTHLAVGGSRSIMIFDAATGMNVLRIEDIGSDISDLALNSDGTKVAISSADNVIRVFDTRTRDLLQLIPYDGGGGGLIFSEDGKRLLAAFGGDNKNNQHISQWYVDLDTLSKKLAERLVPLVATGQGFDRVEP